MAPSYDKGYKKTRSTGPSETARGIYAAESAQIGQIGHIYTPQTYYATNMADVATSAPGLANSYTLTSALATV